MDTLMHALRGANATLARQSARAEVLLVLGGGGMLGAALVARALACGRFARVQAAVDKPLASALRGFEPLPAERLGGRLQADTAVIVFERAWRSNGRDEAFLQPQPAHLAMLAAQLRAGGVRRLLVVVPHAPTLLPQALKQGFASIDEGRVAAMGFEQLLFVRSAQSAAPAGVAHWSQRLAAAWWSQLAWMVPQSEQPVRAPRVAELAVELAWRMADAPSATRVLSPELLRQAAHSEDGGGLLSAWLEGAPLPRASAPAQRW